MADMAELTNCACLVAGDLNSRPPRPPDDPRRPSHQLGRAPHALDGRACVRPTCTMWCARVRMCVTVGSRRKCARRVLRRIVDPRGQNPSVESMCRVPGQWHRQWTALDLIERALNMCYFRGAAKHGLGVNPTGFLPESAHARAVHRLTPPRDTQGAAQCGAREA